ncbi:MAG: nuclear transport factor 2 family protein [Bacteroidota bacterium]
MKVISHSIIHHFLQQLITCCLFLSAVCIGYSQGHQADENNAKSPFIFDQHNLDQNIKDLSAIYAYMGKYYRAVEKAEVNLLDEVFHSGWFMRDTDTPKEATLNVENKATFIKRVKDHGPYPGYASERVFADVGMANDDLAFVRVNRAATRSSTCFFLFKMANGWTIMDKLWVPVREAATTHASKAHSTIEEMLNGYFQALAQSDAKAISQMLHEDWNVKSIGSGGTFKTSSKTEFLESVQKQKQPIDHSQLLSINIYHEKLAVVRIDIPSKSATSYLILFKIGNEWKIVSERKTTKMDDEV